MNRRDVQTFHFLKMTRSIVSIFLAQRCFLECKQDWLKLVLVVELKSFLKCVHFHAGICSKVNLMQVDIIIFVHSLFFLELVTTFALFKYFAIFLLLK